MILETKFNVGDWVTDGNGWAGKVRGVFADSYQHTTPWYSIEGRAGTRHEPDLEYLTRPCVNCGEPVRPAVEDDHLTNGDPYLVGEPIHVATARWSCDETWGPIADIQGGWLDEMCAHADEPGPFCRMCGSAVK